MDLPSWMWPEIKNMEKFLIADILTKSVADHVEISVADSVEKSVAAFVEFYCRIRVSIFIVEILCRYLV